MRLTRYGIREWLTATVLAAAAAAILVIVGWWPAVALVVALWAAVVWFFRDPNRRPPPDLAPGTMLSPADGTVTAVSAVEHHDAVGGPAVVIRVFLSVFDVHVNRSPGDGRVTALLHTPGRFHDARTLESVRENESQLITMQLDDGGPAIGVRQIAGKVARRIVCDLSQGERLRRGMRFGMIKFGSGTELIVPRERLGEVHVREGDRVKGGVTVLATLENQPNQPG